MSTIVTRAGKGSPLENSELDLNFTNLNTDKLEINAALGTPASVTLTNATGLPTAGLVDNAVTNEKLRDSAGLSVIGRGANSTGDPADIVAGTNHQVLRRDGSSLAFGAVDLSSNQAVTGTLPVNQGGTGITSFGSGVATWLGTPSSANLAAAVTDETGTGALVFGTNPVIDGATVPARTNPLAQAVSVQMTASTTVGGIQQLDNAQTRINTNDFSIHATDFVYGVNHVFFGSRPDSNNRIFFGIGNTGTLALTVDIAGVNIYSITMGSAASYYNKCLSFDFVMRRETAATAGEWWLYINGGQVATGVITARATPDISVIGTVFYNSGNTAATLTTSRAQSSFYRRAIFNRALTAAEVLDLSINGVALADRGASQSPVYTSDFSAGTDSWVDRFGTALTGNTDSIGGEDDWLQAEVSSGSPSIDPRFRRSINAIRAPGLAIRVFIPATNAVITQIRVSFRVSLDSADLRSVLLSPVLGTVTDYVLPGELLSGNVGFMYIRLRNSSDTNPSSALADKIYIKNVQLRNTGVTSELIASNAQSNTGQIFDTSGNKNHALLPASGATVVGRPVSQTREVRWTNTWAGTNELQYIGGVNQAILPANAYIESIVGTVSGATPHDIIIGDGSDADRYVTITTGLAAGTTNFALAARTTDGTNLKLTVDPDTDCSMSIAWAIRFSTLEA
jgi:hypothetical protein